MSLHLPQRSEQIFVLIFDILLLVMAVFQHVLPKFLGGGLCNAHVPNPTIRTKIWNCTPQSNCSAIPKLWRKFFAHREKVDLLRWISWVWGCRASRGGRGLTIRPDYMIRANSVVYRHQPKAAHDVVYPRVYSICTCKYNACPKSVWKYTHLANDRHKPYTARISFSSKLASIVFFGPQKDGNFSFSKDIFVSIVFWHNFER